MMPIGIFIATAAALNVAHRENEIVVAQASGLSNWQVASPVLRLATLAAILHLGLNLWIQPAASRELRETITEASTDLAASLVTRRRVHHPRARPHHLRPQGRRLGDHLPGRQQQPEPGRGSHLHRQDTPSSHRELKASPRSCCRTASARPSATTARWSPAPSGSPRLSSRAFVNTRSARRCLEESGPLPARTLLSRHVELLRPARTSTCLRPKATRACRRRCSISPWPCWRSRRCWAAISAGAATPSAIAMASGAALAAAPCGVRATLQPGGDDPPAERSCSTCCRSRCVVVVSYFFYLQARPMLAAQASVLRRGRPAPAAGGLAHGDCQGASSVTSSS